jgi:transposase
MYRKLTEHEALTARKLYRDGLTCEEIGARLDISGNAIHGLISGRSWGWLADANGPLQLRRKGPRTGKAFQAKINPTIANEIRLELLKGASHKALAEKHQVSPSTVYKIGQGKIWKDQV